MRKAWAASVSVSAACPHPPNGSPLREIGRVVQSIPVRRCGGGGLSRNGGDARPWRRQRRPLRLRLRRGARRRAATRRVPSCNPLNRGRGRSIPLTHILFCSPQPQGYSRYSHIFHNIFSAPSIRCSSSVSSARSSRASMDSAFADTRTRIRIRTGPVNKPSSSAAIGGGGACRRRAAEQRKKGETSLPHNDVSFPGFICCVFSLTRGGPAGVPSSKSSS